MPRSRTRLARATLVVLAAGVPLFTIGFVQRARSVWEEALVVVDRLESELDQRQHHRPALWGATHEDRAYPHYDMALTCVEGWEPDDVILARRGEGERALATRERLLAEGAEALEHLGRGAHARDATRAVDWSEGFEISARKLFYARMLVQLGELQATAHLESGDDLEAVRVLLDGLQFAGDLAQGPILIEEMIGVSQLVPELLLELIQTGAIRDLSPEAHVLLARGLTQLAGRLDWTSASLEGELVLGTRGVQNALAGGPGLDILDAAVGCGVLGGPRIQREAATHVLWTSARFEALEEARLEGPEAHAAVLTEIEQRILGEGDSMAATFLPWVLSAQRARSYSVGRFRLLVHAVTGDDLASDPWLDGCLRSQSSAEGTRLWLDEERFGSAEIWVAP